MIRLLALLLLVVLVGGGLYYWRTGRALPEGAPESLEAVGDRLTDAALTGAVKGAFELNRHLAPLPLSVDAEDGVVTLRGPVPEARTAALAEQVAAAVPRVRQVVNHLRVEATATAPMPDTSRSLGESLDDQAIGVRVRLAFSLNRQLEGSAVEVAVFRRAVRLTGRVRSDDQRRLAVELARDVPGVDVVTDALEVRESEALTKVEAEPVGPVAAAETALAANANLAPYRLRAERRQGRLVLRGEVRSGAERDLAGLLAASASGLPVENEIRVKR